MFNLLKTTAASKTIKCRLFSTTGIKAAKFLGQPSYETHPHLMAKNEITPGFDGNEYKQRRDLLLDAFPDGSLLILPGPSLSLMSNDIPYRFRQNSEVSYYSGFKEPDSLLLLSKKNNKNKFTMVVPPKDPLSETWDGTRSGVNGALKFFNADEAIDYNQLSQKYLKTLLEDYEHIFFDPKPTATCKYHTKISEALLASNKKSMNSAMITQSQRSIKTAAEIHHLRKVCQISSVAFSRVMAQTTPDISEHFIDSLLEFECRIRGCQRLAYPPVVAGGSNALTLHYINNDEILKDGDLLLIDGGGELFDYASDITRSFPVNGKFSDPQKIIYEIVLEVQLAIIEMSRSNENVSLNMLHRQSAALFTKHLREASIIPSTLNDIQAGSVTSKYFPHLIGHYLGMDTHDTPQVPKSIPLKNGMVITVEPGLYFPQNDLDIPAEFRGIGIRTEDNILITENGPENLTSSCPKTIQEIEEVMKK